MPMALAGGNGTGSWGWFSFVIANKEQHDPHTSSAPHAHRTAGAYGTRRRFGSSWLYNHVNATKRPWMRRSPGGRGGVAARLP